VLGREHRDRLAYFGTGHLESVLAAAGRRIVVLDPDGTANGLADDVAEVLTWRCGRRSAKGRAAGAVAAAAGQDAP
jgi:putative resolvase